MLQLILCVCVYEILLCTDIRKEEVTAPEVSDMDKMSAALYADQYTIQSNQILSSKSKHSCVHYLPVYFILTVCSMQY